MAQMKAIYKCRLCGKRFWVLPELREEEKAYRDIMELIIKGKPDDLSETGLYELHRCESSYEGSLGLGDFQGFRNIITIGDESERDEPEGDKPEGEETPVALYDRPWENVLNLSVRAHNCLRRWAKQHSITTVKELAELPYKDIYYIRNMGSITRAEIAEALRNIGIYGTDWEC